MTDFELMKIDFHWKCFVGSLWHSCFINCILNDFFKLAIRVELLNTENALPLFLWWIFWLIFWQFFFSDEFFWQIFWWIFDESFANFLTIFFTNFLMYFLTSFLTTSLMEFFDQFFVQILYNFILPIIFQPLQALGSEYRDSPDSTVFGEILNRVNWKPC